MEKFSRRQALSTLAGAAAAALAPAVAFAAPQFSVADYVAGWRAVCKKIVPADDVRSFNLEGPFTDWGSLDPKGAMAQWENATPDFAAKVCDFLEAEAAKTI